MGERVREWGIKRGRVRERGRKTREEKISRESDRETMNNKEIKQTKRRDMDEKTSC